MEELKIKTGILRPNQNKTYKFFSDMQKNYSELASRPLFWDKFLGDFLSIVESDESTNVFKSGPRKIRVCPSEQELCKYKTGEIPKPVREFTIEEVPKMNVNGVEYPIWMSKPDPSIFVDFGWEDGIKGQVSNYGWGKFGQIHSFIGGSTGSGKSVANNSLLFNVMCRYGPWDVQFFMADAKVSEFKRYADEHHIPHIKAISAAFDQSYAITMVHYVKHLMDLRYKAFAKLNVQNYKDYKKVTGLDMPLLVLVLEEIQAMFQLATNREKKEITKDLDLIMRLGRAAGVHCHGASQSLEDSIPDSIMKQIGLRIALMSDSSTSMKLIGNERAKEITAPGKGIVNANIDKENCEKYNTIFQIPFQTKDMFNDFGKALEEAGKKYGYEYDTSFYDEGFVLEEEVFDNYLEELKNTLKKDTLYLGPMARYTTDENKLYKIKYGEDSGEGIIVTANSLQDFKRQWKLFEKNFNRFERVSSPYDNGDKIMIKTFWSDKLMYQGLDINPVYKATRIKSVEDPMWNLFFLKRPFILSTMIAIDELVFKNNFKTDEVSRASVKEFAELNRNPKLDTEIMASRLYYLAEIMKKDKALREGLNFVIPPGKGSLLCKEDRPTIDENGLIKKDENGKEVTHKEDRYIPEFHSTIVSILMNFSALIPENMKAEVDILPTTYIVLFGGNNTLGFQKSNDYRMTTRLKKAMDEGSEVKVNYIIFTRSYDELSEIRSACKYIMSAGLDGMDLSRYAKGIDCIDVKENLSCIVNLRTKVQEKYIRYTLPED